MLNNGEISLDISKEDIWVVMIWSPWDCHATVVYIMGCSQQPALSVGESSVIGCLAILGYDS